MCYYVSQKTNHKIEFNDITRESDLLDRPVVGGFSGAPIAVMKPDVGSKTFDVVGMEWGFLPNYLQHQDAVQKFKNGYKDASGRFIPGFTTLNATAEGLFKNQKGQKSMFADAVHERRCLVPVAGYYEWRHIYRINSRTGQPLKTPDKYPYFIRVKGMPVFYHAGIWNEWTDRETGETFDTVAFTTTEANGIAAQIHNSKLRMPTMLSTDLARAWLFDTLTDEDITAIAKIQFPASEMEAWTIDSKFLSALDPMAPCPYEAVPELVF